MTKTTAFSASFDGLLELVARLRGPGGCPWDREQTRDTMKRYLLEECYELLEAMDENDDARVAEELGDVLFNLAVHMHMGLEEGTYSDERVFASVIDKLVRRHPHVFGDAAVDNVDEVWSNWQRIKKEERGGEDSSVLEGVPGRLPALAFGQALQERAAKVGFDWEDVPGVLEKVQEEMDEFSRASSSSEREAEFGDILFSMVNFARWHGIDAESALRKSATRFRRRFGLMEGLSRRENSALSSLTLVEKEALWQKAKRPAKEGEGGG